MKLKSLLFFGVILVAVSFLVHDYLTHNPGVCPYDEAACYFSEHYYESRALFKDRAKQLNLNLYSQQIKNTKVKDLSIDIAIMNEPKTEEQKKQPTIIHISGTHGVEAYAGASIQIAYLEKIRQGKIQPPKDVTIVFIHALNPFGFLFNRRWNENGVDLNRNVLPEDTYPGDLQKLVEVGALSNYKQYEKLLNSDHQWNTPLDDIIFVFELIYNIIKIGFSELKQCLVSGQYYCKDCIWYGGDKLQPSHEYILKFLKEKVSNAEKAILIDVHTGLGPEGIDTLMATTKGSKAVRKLSQNSQVSEDILGKHYFIDDSQTEQLPYGMKEETHKSTQNTQDAVKTDVGQGYELLKGSTFNLLQSIKIKKGLSITQEFGTVPGPLVFRALKIENSYWAHNGNDDLLAQGGQAVKNVFHRENVRYKTNVVRRGLILLQQAIDGIQDQNVSELLQEYY